MNVRDSEAVESLMTAAGHEKAAGEDDAEVVIINSCTGRQQAEEKAVGKSGNMLAAGKITGIVDGRGATKEEIGLLMTKTDDRKENS